MPNLSFSICIPVYKGSHVLRRALTSIFNQKFTNFEILIADDTPSEFTNEISKTYEIINSFKNSKIRYIKNKTNLGSALNIKNLADNARNEILFFLCQDDILLEDSLFKTRNAFLIDNDIGAVTRPYYWFEKNITKPVRTVFPPDINKDTIFSTKDEGKAISAIFGSVGQISGLAYRKEFITIPFHKDTFPGHIYPYASIFKNHKCVFLKDFTVAIGISDSQTRHLSSIYDSSPTIQWVKMFETIFNEKKYENLKRLGIKHIATHFPGLVQLKSYGRQGVLTREILILLKYYPLNIINPKFWFYSLLTLLTPKKLLIFLTDNYKRLFLSKTITI